MAIPRGDGRKNDALGGVLREGKSSHNINNEGRAAPRGNVNRRRSENCYASKKSSRVGRENCET